MYDNRSDLFSTMLDSQSLADIPDRSLSMTRFGVAIATLAVSLFPSGALAQQMVQTPRADGAATPLQVYAASVEGCAPLALISPGAGGSENGYRYLAEGMRSAGWRAIVMGHKESGRAALMDDVRGKRGIKRGLQELVDDPKAYDARLMDI